MEHETFRQITNIYCKECLFLGAIKHSYNCLNCCPPNASMHLKVHSYSHTPNTEEGRDVKSALCALDTVWRVCPHSLAEEEVRALTS